MAEKEGLKRQAKIPKHKDSQKKEIEYSGRSGEQFAGCFLQNTSP